MDTLFLWWKQASIKNRHDSVIEITVGSGVPPKITVCDHTVLSTYEDTAPSCKEETIFIQRTWIMFFG